LQPSHYRPTRLSRSMEERGRGKFSVNHHIVDEACSQVLAHASQQTLPGSVFTVARPIGFHVHRQDEVAADHGREHQMMPVAGDFFLGIAVGTAQGAALLSPPSAGGPVQSEAYKSAVLEGLVAFGAMEHGGQRDLRVRRIYAYGEVNISLVA